MSIDALRHCPNLSIITTSSWKLIRASLWYRVGNHAEIINQRLKEFVLTMQEFLQFSVHAFASVRFTRKYWKEIVNQMYVSGTESVPIIFVSSVAIGCLLTVEVGNQLEGFGAKLLTGRTTAMSVIREMDPSLPVSCSLLVLAHAMVPSLVRCRFQNK